MSKQIVHSDPETLGGIPIFVGTRVPFRTLYDYLEAGDSIEEFLNDFPGVGREQAIAALELGREHAFVEAVNAGLEDVQSGRVVGHDEVRSRLKGLIDSQG